MVHWYKRLCMLLAPLLLVYPIQAFTVSKPKLIPPLHPGTIKPKIYAWHSTFTSSSFRRPTKIQAFPGNPPSTYYLTRIVFLRALAFVYFVAFTVAYRQNKALIGDNGITPARYILEEARDRAGKDREFREGWLQQMFDQDGRTEGDKRKNPDAKGLSFWASKLLFSIRKSSLYQRTREVVWDRADKAGRPLLSVLWLAKDFNNINPWLDGVALTGMSLAALVGVLGAANVPLLLALWVCQRSLMAVGGVFYGFGWEPQLAELGFHALFLVPLLSLNPISTTPVPLIVVWAIRWHLFRIMLGSGLIKFRSGDKKWKDLTTMDYFYETQPVPSLLTRRMHFMPAAWHKFEVLTNHFVEVVAPFFLLFPGPPSLLRFAGLLQMQFQAILISTGNLSFLNWLTMVPAIFCLDDAFIRGLFSPLRVVEASIAAAYNKPSILRRVITVAFGALVAWLSVPVVRNLLSKRQKMIASFDPLRLINSYGAFGVVSEQREEWIIKSAAEMDGEWKEYEFKVKPGSVTRPPRWITPYHYRLDWQMWIAACGGSIDRSPWMYRFLAKLLQGDQEVLDLMASNPWENDDKGPKYIRVDSYNYRFNRGKTPYWERSFSKRIYPREGAATIESLKKEVPLARPL